MTMMDLTDKSDEELRQMLDALCQEEEKISYKRRMLHGKIDILRAELVSRLKDKRTRGEKLFSRKDIDRLSEILAEEGTGVHKKVVEE